MPYHKNQIRVDPVKGKIQAKFYEFKDHSQKNAVRRYICTIEELNHKKTTRGLKKRTEREKEIFLDQKYNEKLLELQGEREKIQVAKKESGYKISEIFNLWLDHIKCLMISGHRSENSFKKYKLTASQYLKSAGDHLAHKYNSKNTTKFLKMMADSGNSQRTQWNHAVNLQSCFNWAFSNTDENGNKLILNLIKVDLPKKPQKEQEVYSEEEINSLENLARRKCQDATNKKHKKLFLAQLRSIVLARYTGMRGGEIWSCKLKDFNLEKRTITICSKEIEYRASKGVNKKKWKPKHYHERSIPISTKLMDFLIDDFKNRNEKENYYLDDGSGLIIYSSNDQLRRAIGCLCKAISIKSSIKPLHGIRAFLLTKLAEKRWPLKDLQKLAGHNDIKTTLGYIKSSNKTLTTMVEDA